MMKQTAGAGICDTGKSIRLLLSRKRTMAWVALIALCVMFAPSAKAQCGSTALTRRASALPAVFWPEEALSFPVESAKTASEANTEDGQEAPIIGLWRIK